ncbi:intracellular serine protease [Fusarium heterosporum]|uniref:Intracellular serine protease n=1 Tax=Fusarium heterosporum TaxID=42747 RepID=A0A8H5TYD1_FUSHE|nr:intracellular serine protease [Fusarium heterosporum]
MENDKGSTTLRNGWLITTSSCYVHPANAKKGNDETYPHDAKRDVTIRIGAATATGNKAGYVNKNKNVFPFPGQEVCLKGSIPETELGGVHKDPSVATAIAAELAALILECIRLSYVWKLKPENCGTGKDFVRTNSRRMMAMFKGIGISESCYIWGWEMFSASICEKIVDGESGDKHAAGGKLGESSFEG